MSSPHDISEAIVVIEPEEVELAKFPQPSVIERARQFHSSLARYGNAKEGLHAKGLFFGGRVLLLGNPGSDFDSFPYYLATEVPLKLIVVKVEHQMTSDERIAEAARTLIEVAKRNAPVVIFIRDIDAVTLIGSPGAIYYRQVLQELDWDNMESIIVASTSQLDRIDERILNAFDRTYAFQFPDIEERKAIIEQAMKDRNETDLDLLAEITEGWGFNDILHLLSVIHLETSDSSEGLTRAKLEEILETHGARSLARKETRMHLQAISKGAYLPKMDITSKEYPSEFLDQLYLMAVGDDFQRTQQVIETLNSNMPLSQEDRVFLNQYPFILSGTSEERLTRLMRAKKTHDRLSRLMGR